MIWSDRVAVDILSVSINPCMETTPMTDQPTDAELSLMVSQDFDADSLRKKGVEPTIFVPLLVKRSKEAKLATDANARAIEEIKQEARVWITRASTIAAVVAVVWSVIAFAVPLLYSKDDAKKAATALMCNTVSECRTTIERRAAADKRLKKLERTLRRTIVEVKKRTLSNRRRIESLRRIIQRMERQRRRFYKALGRKDQ